MKCAEDMILVGCEEQVIVEQPDQLIDLCNIVRVVP